MPVHIDRMDTSVEIVPSAEPAGAPARASDGRTSLGPRDPAGRAALREAVVQVLEEELDSFLRIRGA